MTRALQAWLAAIDGGRAAAVRAACEAVASDPVAVVEQAGPLSRCDVGVAAEDIGLTPDLRVCPPRRGVVVVPRGALHPVHGARRRGAGAWDTPLAMARAVVDAALKEAPRATSALDPACGTGAFLLALAERGVTDVRGTDLDEDALIVASFAAPRARLALADALLDDTRADLVVGNPPFVSSEHQDKALRARLRARFPWLSGRFDLAVPFAAAAVARADAVAALVLPAPILSQPYGAPLRRRWLANDRIAALIGPFEFPGANVEVAHVVIVPGQGPAPVPPHGIDAADLLRLDNAPLDPRLRPGDVGLIEWIRARSVPLGSLCLVDTGVVANRPGGSREALLHDEPGPGRVPYADARDFFAGRRRWLEYDPSRMFRAKRPEMFERDKLVVQRIRGDGPVRAAVDRGGVYVGHTCTVVCPRGEVPLERLLDLVRSPLVAGLIRLERGRRLDLYPRDVASFPVPRAWADDANLTLELAWGLTDAQAGRLREAARRADSG